MDHDMILIFIDLPRIDTLLEMERKGPHMKRVECQTFHAAAHHAIFYLKQCLSLNAIHAYPQSSLLDMT